LLRKTAANSIIIIANCIIEVHIGKLVLIFRLPCFTHCLPVLQFIVQVLILKVPVVEPPSNVIDAPLIVYLSTEAFGHLHSICVSEHLVHTITVLSSWRIQLPWTVAQLQVPLISILGR
jgi:hypothetical protein